MNFFVTNPKCFPIWFIRCRVMSKAYALVSILSAVCHSFSGVTLSTKQVLWIRRHFMMNLTDYLEHGLHRILKLNPTGLPVVYRLSGKAASLWNSLLAFVLEEDNKNCSKQ